MRTLPVGVPKVMVSTVGGGDVSAYAGAKDITFIPSIVDVAGVNSISRTIYRQRRRRHRRAWSRSKPPPAAAEKPLITASMFGNTTEAVGRARKHAGRRRATRCWSSTPPAPAARPWKA